MRPTLAASLALALTAALLPPAALATTEPTPATEQTTESDEPSPASPEPLDGTEGEQLSQPLPEEHLDNRYGLITSNPELVQPTTVTQLTSLPEPAAGAEVYPMPKSGYYSVTGGGFGHRHGMSQYGAHGAGLQGLSHQQILDFYYPGTELETWDTDLIEIGITIDNDGVTRVDHRPGLVVSHGPGATAYPLPTRDQWRVQASTADPSSCVLQARDNAGNWTNYQPKGMPVGCPITFTSPTEKTIDLYLPGGSRRVYRGQITATHHGKAALTTVNRLPMQHYLWSVVSAEMPATFHQQALRAQAVAARTYAQRGVGGTGYYDTCDTTACQAYKGRGERDNDGGITSYEYAENRRAVNATEDEVLTYDFPWGTGLATTMYSSSTGGYTIPINQDHPYLAAQADPYDNTPSNSRYRWEATLSAADLQARYNIHTVTRVQVLTRDGYGAWGGRIVTAKVEGFTADGRYAYNDTTGVSLYLANPWPFNSDGLSTDYFTFTDAQAPAPPGPEPGEVHRIAGSGRYATAAEVANAWAPGVSVVYLVNGEDFPDALSAAARSGIYDAPVLLVKRDSIPEPTQQALKRLKPGRLVVLGGYSAISAQTEQKLRAYSPGTMQRVSGANRYETAANLASYYASDQPRVYLASGEDYPDALTAAAIAAKEHAPLLLTHHDSLNVATMRQLARLDPGEVVVLGGGSAISNAVAQQAGAYASDGYRRIQGASRYDTARKVAQQYPAPATSTIVTSGEEFPDALVGAALAGRRGVPVVLTKPQAITNGTDLALAHLDPHTIFVLGGTSAVSNATFQKLRDYLD